ncbi:MAG TPA: hypothetical protein DDW30_01165 [Clostridiales bacterium]|nr:hypothetical protein [Clostridiales bacterium]
MKRIICRTIGFLLAICLTAPLSPIFTAHAAETASETDDGWTYLDFATDFGAYTYEDNDGDGVIKTTDKALFANSFAGAAAYDRTPSYNTYLLSEDNRVLTIGVPADRSASTGNGGVYSDAHKLEAGKEYIVSVKVKYASAYTDTTYTNRSAAAAMVFGITGVEDGTWKSPWSANCYTAMYHRGNSSDAMRIFPIGYTGSSVQANTQIGNTLTNSLKSSTDWIEISVHITKTGILEMYLNGVFLGLSDESAVWQGGKLGLVTYGLYAANGGIRFTDYKYKEVTESAPVSKASFTQLRALTYIGNGTDTWKTEADTDGATVWVQDRTETTTVHDTLAVADNVTLEKGKAYTVEVQVKFDEAYASGKSRGAGLAIGTFGESWESGTTAYAAMIDRATGTKKHIRMYDQKIYTDIQITTGRAFTEAELASTDWFTIRITITEDGFMTLYLNGEKIGESCGGFSGGQLALNTYGVATRVSFKNLCYTEGVVSAEDGCFDYIGTSVRYGEKSGIRVKSFISSELTNATCERDGYRVTEYGTLVAKVSGLYVPALTLGADGVKRAVAYNSADGTDVAFERTENGVFYTVALYNISDPTALYAFRAYYVKEYADGTTEVCYINSYGNSNQNVKCLRDIAAQIRGGAEYETLTASEKDYIDSLLG